MGLQIKAISVYWHADEVASLLGVSEGAVTGCWNAVTLHEGLWPTFAGLKLRRLGWRPKTRNSSCRQVIHNSWRKNQVVQGKTKNKSTGTSRCDGRSQTCSQGHLWSHNDEPYMMILTELSQDRMVANGNLCTGQRLTLILWKNSIYF